METVQHDSGLLKELTQEKRKNDIIRRLSVELNQLSNLKEKLDNILQMLEENFQLKHSMLLLPESNKQHLKVFASRGFEDKGLGRRVKMGEGVIGVVAMRKRKLRMSNISWQRKYLRTQAAEGPLNDTKTYSLPGLQNVESQVAIPLLANDELIAVLSAESENINFFSREDEEFLMTLSQLLALSIQNAIIMEQLEQKVQERTAALEAKKEELEQLNASKDRLFSIIGHDLRSPAAALQNTTELISYYNQKGDMQQLSCLGTRISTAARNLNAMLDNLLNWSVTQTGDLQMQPELLSIHKLLAEVVDVYQEMAASKRISISLDCPPELRILADKNAALTIFRNLLCNSVKFTPQRGIIQLKAHAASGQTCIIIQDNGLGMDANKLQSLFCLKEGKSSRGTAKEKGIGLGMVLVREFIQRNRASIEVQSQPMQGTRVEMFFPSC